MVKKTRSYGHVRAVFFIFLFFDKLTLLFCSFHSVPDGSKNRNAINVEKWSGDSKIFESR